LDLNLGNKVVNCLIFSTNFKWQQTIRHFRKYVTNNFKLLQCGSGEGWISGGPTVAKLRNITQSRKKHPT